MKQLLLLALPFVFFFLRCSTPDDSPQTAYSYLSQADTLMRSDKLQARTFARKALLIAEKTNDAKLKAACLLKVATTMRYNINLDSLIAYDKEALETARNTKEARPIADALGAYANDLFQINDLATAQKMLAEQKNYCDQLKNDSCQAVYQSLLGLRYVKEMKMAEAQQAYEESRRLAEKSSAPHLAAAAKLKIFQTNVYMGVVDSTSHLAIEAIDYFQKNNYAEGWAVGQQVLGESYFYQGNMNRAVELANTAYPVFVDHQNYMGALAVQGLLLRIAQATENLPTLKSAIEATERYAGVLNYPAAMGMAKNAWGQYYSIKQEFDKADKAFAEADSIADQYNLVSVKAMNTMHKGQHLERQKKYEQADSIAILSYRDIQKGRVISKELIENINKNKAGKTVNILEKKLMEDSATSNDEVKAFLKASRKRSGGDTSEVFIPMLSAFDSSVSMANSRQLMELQEKYQAKALSDSLDIQKKDTALAKQESRTKNLILAGGALLLIAIAIGLSLQIKNRRRAERDKARIQLLQNEIHHRVKNNLAVINRLVDVAGKDSVYDAPLAALKTRIKSIELLHRHLYSEEAVAGNIALQPYFDDLCAAIAATFETAKDIRINIAADAEVDSAVAEKLGLIVTELVTNSFKYAFEGREAGTVTVTAERNGNELNLQVADNGAGTPAEKTKGSYGMRLIKGLSHELNGKFAFANENGTRFRLSVPA